jgi:hypothetical protein
VVAAVEAAQAAGSENYLVAIAGEGSQELIGPPEDKPIEPGAVVILEIAVQVKGYWTQVARAAAALFLTSEEASFITGVAIPVDGGRRLTHSGDQWRQSQSTTMNYSPNTSLLQKSSDRKQVATGCCSCYNAASFICGRFFPQGDVSEIA